MSGAVFGRRSGQGAARMQRLLPANAFEASSSEALYSPRVQPDGWERGKTISFEAKDTGACSGERAERR